MAIGFVSIPPNYKDKADKSFDETARLLIEKLTTHKIPAIGFVSGGSISQEKTTEKFRERLKGFINGASNPADVVQMRSMIENLTARIIA